MTHLKFHTTLVRNYGYCRGGYVQTVTDPRGIVTETTYDMLGQVFQTIDPIQPEIEGSDPSKRSFNAQNQTTSVSGGTAPTYDNNGNTISDKGQTFVYDAWNRLVAAKSGSTTVASYGYDALGRRISETYSGLSTTNFLYYSPPWQVIEERQNGTGTNNVSQQYVWGAAYIDQMISRDTYTSGSISSTLFVLQDANWNVTALTDSSGNVVERYLYDPYGVVTVLNASWVPVSGNVSAFGWRYGHQGGRLDPVTGWYDFRNRDYIPSEGRWAERDPMGFGGGSVNFYNYVGSSPVNMNDPIGLSWLDSYGNWMNDLTGGIYGSAGDYIASQITPYTGVSALANASDTTLFVATAGVSTVAVVGTMYAAPAIATAAVSYGGPIAEAAAMNPEITVGLAYSAYEIFNSVYQGKMSTEEATLNFIMTYLSMGAPGLRLPGSGIAKANPGFSGSSVGCQAGISSNCSYAYDPKSITQFTLSEQLDMRIKHQALISALRCGDVHMPPGSVSARMMGELTFATSQELALIRIGNQRFLRLGGPDSAYVGDASRLIAHTHPSGDLTFSTGSESDISVFTNILPKQRSSVLVAPDGTAVRLPIIRP